MRISRSFSLSALFVAVVALTDAAIPADSLQVGSMAPDFLLPASSQDSIIRPGIRLSDAVRSGHVIVAFYPADWSRGCASEMCTFRDDFERLGELGIQVFGISGDYVYSHREWARHLKLPFVLLSDHDHAVARAYESYNEESGYNRRTVFVVSPEGTIVYLDRSFSTSSGESFKRLHSFLNTIK